MPTPCSSEASSPEFIVSLAHLYSITVATYCSKVYLLFSLYNDRLR